jgi:hypothetical protein
MDLLFSIGDGMDPRSEAEQNRSIEVSLANCTKMGKIPSDRSNKDMPAGAILKVWGIDKLDAAGVPTCLRQIKLFEKEVLTYCCMFTIGPGSTIGFSF